MAFNFNWAPLSGDPGFYKRAEELLTDAMNKNPKPPIIVDDIIVTELNLGDIPPDLEVVEISDIGVDKFRGTFKMSYIGNAFITIKTRVQANPLNTYLVTRPSYASPRPLAAATGLTIPLQITLSDFKLSAIIILVFSRQKGLTIVFRNDPLESLKVSSTFDSIPFVANYLQQVIEGQLRTLFMDELPAIIHRMSLRLWVPEHKTLEERILREEEAATQDEPAVDPLASQPEDPVDASGITLSPSDVAALSLDSHVETQSLFSRKNLLRLATLTDSHRTLSLFTPNIQDAVFRAWTGPLERGEATGSHSRITTPALSRSHSYSGSISTSYVFDHGPHARPHLHSYTSSTSITSIGGHQLRSHKNRKRKKRVVNLRKQSETGEVEAIIEDGSTITDSTSVTGSYSDGPSMAAIPPVASRVLSTADPVTPPRSPLTASYLNASAGGPSGQVLDDATPHAKPQIQPQPSISSPSRYHHEYSDRDPPSPLHQDSTVRVRHRQRRVVNLAHRDEEANDETPKASMYLPARTQPTDITSLDQQTQKPQQQPTPRYAQNSTQPPHQTVAHEKQPSLSAPSSAQPQPNAAPQIPNFLSFIADSSNSSSIAERAWMMKMAAEVAKRYEEERVKGSFESAQTSAREDPDDRPPPPAYAR